jgi:hypothetical protein
VHGLDVCNKLHTLFICDIVYEIYMLEDRMSNVEAGPWEVDQTYTG